MVRRCIFITEWAEPQVRDGCICLFAWSVSVRLVEAPGGSICVDRLAFSDTELSLRVLSVSPTVAHREHVAVEVLRAAWRLRRLCAALALAAAGLSVAYLVTRSPSYPAEAIIEFHVGRADLAGGESAVGVQIEASAIVLSEARIIRSRMITARVVQRLGLADDADFMREGLASRSINRLERALGIPMPRANPIADAERRLSRSLSVETDNRSLLVSIRFIGARPEFAALVANTIAEEYLARRLEATMDTADHTATWLTAQVASAEQAVLAADAAIRALRERTGLVHLGVTGETLRQQEVRSVATQLEALVTEWRADEQRLLVIEAALRSGGAGAAASELSTVPAVLSASQLAATTQRDLAEVQSRLGPRHPAYEQAQAAQTTAEARLEQAVENALTVLRTGLSARRAAEEALRARFNRLEQNLIAEAAVQAELTNLASLANAARDRLLALSRSRDQARSLRELRLVPAALIVPAQPPNEASRPNLLLVLLGALIAGLLTGISLSVLLERRDRGFRTSDQVSGATGLRCLSLVPERDSRDPSLTDKAWPAETPGQMMFDESIRTVASSIGIFNSAQRDGGRIVLVSSSVADEGRSSLCAGLARSLTLAGRRVLLIDGPPRRFDTAGSSASAALDGKTEDTQTLAAPGPTGLTTVNPDRSTPFAASVDVFGYSAMAASLEQARKHFDVIIIEGPPVLLVADSLVLGRMADNVLHAVRWGETKRRDVLAALSRMREHGAAVDGVVLTRVDVAEHQKLGLADSAAHHLSPHGYYARHGAGRRGKTLAHGR